MASPLKLGVIGCGGIAQMMHLPFLADHPDLFEVVGLCDVDENTLSAVGRRFHVSNLFADERALLDLPIDAVLISTPGTHGRQVVAAARAGKHVFVEKPLTFSLDEALRVREELASTAVTVMVGYMKRYDPSYRHARELVSGLVDPRLVQVNVWHPDDSAYRTHHAIYSPPPIVARPAQSPARGLEGLVTRGELADSISAALGKDAPLAQRAAYFMLFQSLVHQVNAIRGLLGEPEEVLSTHVWHESDGIQSTLRFPNDLLCTLTWVSLPGLRKYQEQYLILSPERRISLEFPSPYLRHFPTQLRVTDAAGEATWEHEGVLSYREAFHEELLHFHACVTNGTPPETGVDEAIRDAEALLRIARAYRGG